MTTPSSSRARIQVRHSLHHQICPVRGSRGVTLPAPARGDIAHRRFSIAALSSARCFNAGRSVPKNAKATKFLHPTVCPRVALLRGLDARAWWLSQQPGADRRCADHSVSLWRAQHASTTALPLWPAPLALRPGAQASNSAQHHPIQQHQLSIAVRSSLQMTQDRLPLLRGRPYHTPHALRAPSRSVTTATGPPHHAACHSR